MANERPKRKLHLYTEEKITEQAQELFRILHGAGDSGSKSEYYCQNPARIEGWERLAIRFLDQQSRLLDYQEFIDNMVVITDKVLTDCQNFTGKVRSQAARKPSSSGKTPAKIVEK